MSHDAGVDEHAATLELLAGEIGGCGNADGSAASARFSSPKGVAMDGAGNLYVADEDNHTIRKISAAGVVSTFAGSAGNEGTIDGTGGGAHFSAPSDVAIDGSGNLYVADSDNSTIRKITPAGVVTTFAGAPRSTGSDDGATARFDHPGGVAVDAAGNVYVADTGNSTIRKITSGGVVSTLAGSTSGSGSDDGTGAQARFAFPQGLAVDGAGNVYVADSGNDTIRKITPTGVVTTIAGSPHEGGSTDGTGGAARFSGPRSIAVDRAGNLVVSEANTTIRHITPAGVVTTIAGVSEEDGSTDGPVSVARFSTVKGVAVDAAGNILLADNRNCAIRKLTPAGLVTTVAGAAHVTGHVDGPRATAILNFPSGVAIDSAHNVYFSEFESSTLRKITPTGDVITIIGAADPAPLSFPNDLAIDAADNLYLADTNNEQIRKITPAGVITTLAGDGEFGSDDGPGATARFDSPVGLALDVAGNAYVTDQGNQTIRHITPDGVVTTLAGVVGRTGSNDSPNARFNFANDLAVDAAGNVFIADSDNQTIRKLAPDGTVTTFAGAAGQPGTTDGPGTSARFNDPEGIVIDPAGNLYVSDDGSATIRRITPDGTTTTIAGTPGVHGVRLGGQPRLGHPQFLAITGDSLVLSDGNAVLLLKHVVH